MSKHTLCFCHELQDTGTAISTIRPIMAFTMKLLCHATTRGDQTFIKNVINLSDISRLRKTI